MRPVRPGARTAARLAGLLVLALVLAGPTVRAADEPADDAAPPAVTAIVDVTVVPMDSERALPHHTVLLRGDTIAAVGPVDEVAVPEDALRIDGAGRWLMPGLADMHVHLWNPQHLTLFLAHGVTLVRNMWGSPMHLGWRESLASGETFGPALVTAGPLTDGDPPIWPGSAVALTPEEAEDLVDAAADQGYDVFKVYNRLKPEVYEALTARAAERGLPVVGHVPDAVGLRGVLAAGQHTIEHLGGFLETLAPEGRALRHGRWPEDLPEPTDDELAALAREMAASGTWNCTTLIVMTRFVPDEEAARFLEHPSMKSVDAFTKGSWQPKNDFRQKEGADAAAYLTLRRGDALRKRFVRALRDAGAPLLLGSDTPNPYLVPGYSIHQELEQLVASGLTPFEALAAGTRDAARSLGREEVFGTVAPGRRADLLLLEADPLADVGNAQRRVGVFRLGVFHTEAQLQERLEALVN